MAPDTTHPTQACSFSLHDRRNARAAKCSKEDHGEWHAWATDGDTDMGMCRIGEVFNLDVAKPYTITGKIGRAATFIRFHSLSDFVQVIFAALKDGTLCYDHVTMNMQVSIAQFILVWPTPSALPADALNTGRLVPVPVPATCHFGTTH